MVVCLCVSVSVCLLVTFVSPANTTEPIKMPFWRLTPMGSRNQVLGGQDRTNPFAAERGDKSTMRPFDKIVTTCLARATCMPRGPDVFLAFMSYLK